MIKKIFDEEPETTLEGSTETVAPLDEVETPTIDTDSQSGDIVPAEYSGSSAHCIARETGVKEDDLDPTMSGALRLRYRIFNDTAIRMVLDDQKNAWFVADDICKILGYTKDTAAVIKKHCNKVYDSKDLDGTNELAKKITVDTKGGKQAMIAINEPDLYRLIMRSRMPDARKFEKWVVEDVLPTIRKTGKYTVKRKIDYAAATDATTVAPAEESVQCELFPNMMPSMTFPKPLTEKINAAKQSLFEHGTTFPSNKDFLKFLVKKGIDSLMN